MEVIMTDSFSEKKEALRSETTSKLSPGKKNWQSPELTEVDYSQTNMNWSGFSGDDGMYYS